MDDKQNQNTNLAEEVEREGSSTQQISKIDSSGESESLDRTVEDAEEAMEVAEKIPVQNKALNIIQLENIINGYLGDLEKFQQELKEQSQMFRDALENDAEYATIVAKAREVSKEKKARQDKLIQEPSLALVDSKIKDIKADVKDTQQALSDYLQQYYEQSGLRQITGTDGEIRDIVTTVKLVKKKD